MKGEKMSRPSARVVAAAVPVAVLLLLSERPVHAYIDPGTGSYVTQVIVATIVSAGFILRSYWARVKETCRRFFTRGRQ
jgi:hypothetical protein